MYFKQFYLGCLAHGSYLIGANGEGAVIDPQRDVDQYIEEAQKNGLKIKYILETHLHADFVSGHRELADRTGAQIVFGAKAGAVFPHIAARDGDKLKVGTIELTILETPGHTPESICILAFDTAEEQCTAKLFSGDTLFIGDVGRPDLVGSKGFSQTQMATMLYDSLHRKLAKLEDCTEVYPAHGAGSLCGKNLSDEKSSTIGKQKMFNLAFRPGISEDEFVKMVTSNLPEVPAYFPKDAELNRQGAVALNDIPRPQAMTAQEVNKEMQRGVTLLDLRSGADFAKGHVKGAMNIGLSGQFASWAGTLIDFGTPIVLLGADLGSIDEAVMRLARIGIETVVGYLEGGTEAWRDAGFELTQSSMITPPELKEELETSRDDCFLLDVRRIGEFEDGHVAHAVNIPLAELPGRTDEVPAGKKILLICQSGYRSSIAKSVLERAGFSNLVNVSGGTKAWKDSGHKVVSVQPASA